MEIVITVDDKLIADQVQWVREYHEEYEAKSDEDLEETIEIAVDSVYDETEEAIIAAFYSAVMDHIDKAVGYMTEADQKDA